jgi:hypothetical protein
MSYERSVPLGSLANWPVQRSGLGPIPGGPTSGDRPAPRSIPLGPTIPYQKQGMIMQMLAEEQARAAQEQQMAGLSETLLRLLGGGLPIGPRFDESRNFNDNLMVPGGMGGGPPVPPLRIPNGLFQRGQMPLVGMLGQTQLAGRPRSYHAG